MLYFAADKGYPGARPQTERQPGAPQSLHGGWDCRNNLCLLLTSECTMKQQIPQVLLQVSLTTTDLDDEYVSHVTLPLNRHLESLARKVSQSSAS